MFEILIAMASGLAINVITRLSGKLGVSKTYVSVGLCLLLGVLIYVMQILIDQYPLQRQEIVAFASGSYGFSQMCYNLYQKYVEQKLDKKE